MRIEAYQFGRIRIDGNTYTNDVKIINNRVKPKWWRKTGHLVDLDELSDIVAANPDILVLGTGDSGNMKLAPGLEDALAAKGIEVIAKPTAKAVEDFNQLAAENRDVAAGFHLTC